MVGSGQSVCRVEMPIPAWNNQPSHPSSSCVHDILPPFLLSEARHGLLFPEARFPCGLTREPGGRPAPTLTNDIAAGGHATAPLAGLESPLIGEHVSSEKAKGKITTTYLGQIFPTKRIHPQHHRFPINSRRKTHRPAWTPISQTQCLCIPARLGGPRVSPRGHPPALLPLNPSIQMMQRYQKPLPGTSRP